MTQGLHGQIQQYLRDSDNAQTKQAKGKILEDLVAAVFGQIPGITITRRNTRNTFDTEEVDVAFYNEMYPDGLRSFPDIILVECKNWSKRVGSIDVAWFYTKLRDRSLSFGILVAVNGITGNPAEKQDAHGIVYHEFSRGLRMIVITRTELEALADVAQLVRLIKEKVCDLAVGGTLFS